MYTTRSFVSGVLAIGLVAILSGYGLAAEQPGSETTIIITEPSQDTMARLESDTTEMSGQPVLLRTSKLIGKPLKDIQGEKIGTIHDLVVTEDFDNVSYAAVSTGGVFGLGRKLHAVPWSAIKLGIGDSVTAPIDARELEQDRGFSDTYWPAEGDPRWAGRAGERTEEVTYGAQTAADRESIQSRRVSRIKGIMVKEPHGRDVGTVQDLVVAMDSGRVTYTIVSHGGLLGMGQRYSAVPTGAVVFQPERNIARLEVDEQVLQANSFAPGQFPNLSDPLYARRIHESYGVETGPDWVVLGFVAPEEPPTTGTAERPAAPPTRDTTMAPAPSPGPIPAAPTESELTGTFDPARVGTIEGTVTDLGKYKCPKTGMDMLWFRVRANDGRITTVNAGPRDYIAKQDFYVVKGDQIRLTGSDVASATAGKRVFLPTEIVFGTHTLRLADASGRPLWEAHMRETGQRPGAMGQTPAESQPQSREEPTMPDETDVLGYVPGEERAAAERMEPREFAPAGTQAIGAFDLTNMRTIEGTVAEIGKSKVAAGTPDLVWLRVTTAEGRPVNVQVGPRDYISKQNFFIVDGDRVRLTGWDTRLETPGATPVFILANITHDGQILQLRNRSGEPLWEPRAGVPEQQPGTTGQVPAEDHAEHHAESQPEPDESAQD